MECEDISKNQNSNENVYYQNNPAYQYNQNFEQLNFENAFAQMNLIENQAQQSFPKQNSNENLETDLNFGQDNSQKVVTRKYNLRNQPCRQMRELNKGQNIQNYNQNNEQMMDEHTIIENNDLYDPNLKNEGSEDWEDVEDCDNDSGEENTEMSQETDLQLLQKMNSNPQMMAQHLHQYQQYLQQNIQQNQY